MTGITIQSNNARINELHFNFQSIKIACYALCCGMEKRTLGTLSRCMFFDCRQPWIEGTYLHSYTRFPIKMEIYETNVGEPWNELASENLCMNGVATCSRCRRRNIETMHVQCRKFVRFGVGRGELPPPPVDGRASVRVVYVYVCTIDLQPQKQQLGSSKMYFP